MFLLIIQNIFVSVQKWMEFCQIWILPSLSLCSTRLMLLTGLAYQKELHKLTYKNVGMLKTSWPNLLPKIWWNIFFLFKCFLYGIKYISALSCRVRICWYEEIFINHLPLFTDDLFCYTDCSEIFQKYEYFRKISEQSV